MNRSLACPHDTSNDAARRGSGGTDRQLGPNGRDDRMSPRPPAVPAHHSPQPLTNPRATLRDTAQPFNFFAAQVEPPGESGCDDEISAQAARSQDVAGPDSDADPVPDADESDRATLRNLAQPFHFPVEFIDRRLTASDRPEQKAETDGEIPPPPEPADPEELRAAWSCEFSAHARLTEPQKNAIALILAGEKEVRIAQRVGVHRGTLWRWRRQDPNFRRALEFARRRAYALAAEQLRELVPRAIQIVQDEIDRDNFQAAVRVLRMARLDEMSPVYPTTPTSK